MSGSINMDEWWAELQRVMKTQAPEGFTSVEAADGWGVSIYSARERIRVGVRRGHIEFVGHRPVTRIDGRADRAPVYRFVKQKKERG